MAPDTTSRHGITTLRAAANHVARDQHLPAKLQILGHSLLVVRVERVMLDMQVVLPLG